jgi:hypothetical protein
MPSTQPWLVRLRDGLSLPGLALPVAKMVVRTFDMGRGVWAKDHQLADASLLLVVLGTLGDDPEHWLVAGQALQASYLNQSAQVPLLRSKLQQLLGHSGFAQVVLRLGCIRMTPQPRHHADHWPT